jgi:hypothetical protein
MLQAYQDCCSVCFLVTPFIGCSLCLFIRFFARAGRRAGRRTRRGLRHRPGRRRLRQGGRPPPGWRWGFGDNRGLLSAALDAFRCRSLVQSTAYGAFNLPVPTDRRGSEAHILFPSNALSSTRPLKFDVPQIGVLFADVNCLDRPGHVTFLFYLQDILGRIDLMKPEIPESVRR